MKEGDIMNWELLGEKQGRIEGQIIIFCAKEDRKSDWITNRVKMYEDDGFKVIVKNAVAKKSPYTPNKKEEKN